MYMSSTMSISQKWGNLWNNFLKKQRLVPSCLEIESTHVTEVPEYSPEPLVSDKHYFMIQINQMYLPFSSKLWMTFDPTVFVTSEFTYDNKKLVVPFVVGPDTIKKGASATPIPNGMLFVNTKVAGLHPYKGGDFSLTVVLCQVSQGSSAKSLLKMIEGAANALDYSTTLNSYLKVAHVVLDGVQGLIGIKDGITPLIGLQRQFHPAVGDKVKQSYFVIVDKPSLDKNRFWVKNNELYEGDALDKAQPYVGASFVLYSIRSCIERDDVESDEFPFGAFLERIRREAFSPNVEVFKTATSDLASLYQTMYMSPDLTTNHAKILKETYEKEMNGIHDGSITKPSEPLPPPPPPPSSLDAVLSDEETELPAEVKKEQTLMNEELQKEVLRILDLKPPPRKSAKPLDHSKK
jgi:hypothetical protein